MKESMVGEGPGARMLNRILEGKYGTKWKVLGIKGSAGGKGSTGMWNETQANQQSLAGK